MKYFLLKCLPFCKLLVRAFKLQSFFDNFNAKNYSIRAILIIASIVPFLISLVVALFAFLWDGNKTIVRKAKSCFMQLWDNPRNDDNLAFCCLSIVFQVVITMAILQPLMIVAIVLILLFLFAIS